MKIAKNLILIIFAILLTNMQSLAKATKLPIKTRPNELVEIIKLDPTLKLDIRYATKNNFLGRPIYKQAKAFLQKPVAESLIEVNKEIQKSGFAFLIFDGYRPWSVTKIFWDETIPEKRRFVADPKIGSIHNRGCAVDLTLYDLKTSKPLKMPSEYDDFSEKAYPTYIGGTEEERKNRDFLIKVMKEEDFTPHPNEWWHFNHKSCKYYMVLDIPFEDITSEGFSMSEKPEHR